MVPMPCRQAFTASRYRRPSTCIHCRISIRKRTVIDMRKPHKGVRWAAENAHVVLVDVVAHLVVRIGARSVTKGMCGEGSRGGVGQGAGQGGRVQEGGRSMSGYNDAFTIPAGGTL